MKTKKELNAIKEEAEARNKKLAELSAEELEQVVGAGGIGAESGDDAAGIGGTISHDIDSPRK